MHIIVEERELSIYIQQRNAQLSFSTETLEERQRRERGALKSNNSPLRTRSLSTTTCCRELGIKLLRSRGSSSAAAARLSHPPKKEKKRKEKQSKAAPVSPAISRSVALRSAPLETRHACAFPRTGAPYKYRATGDTVTSWRGEPCAGI